MEAKLKNCVDCGKPLSVTAQSCNECNSTDPFGSKRFNDKLHATIVTVCIIAALVIGGLWYTGIINPVDWLTSR